MPVQNRTAMYLFANRGLGMSTGKIAAQVAHAAVEAYLLTDPKMQKRWRSGGGYAKLVLLARDEGHLHTIDRYLNDRDFKTALIIDEGRTEIEPHQATALGVQVVDRSQQHVHDTFKSFELFTDRVTVTIEVPK